MIWYDDKYSSLLFKHLSPFLIEASRSAAALCAGQYAALPRQRCASRSEPLHRTCYEQQAAAFFAVFQSIPHCSKSDVFCSKRLTYTSTSSNMVTLVFLEFCSSVDFRCNLSLLLTFSRFSVYIQTGLGEISHIQERFVLRNGEVSEFAGALSVKRLNAARIALQA